MVEPEKVRIKYNFVIEARYNLILSFKKLKPNVERIMATTKHSFHFESFFTVKLVLKMKKMSKLFSAFFVRIEFAPQDLPTMNNTKKKTFNGGKRRRRFFGSLIRPFGRLVILLCSYV